MNILRTRKPLVAFALLAAFAAVLLFAVNATAGTKTIRYVDLDPDANDSSNLWQENGDPCTIDGTDYEFCYDSIQGAIDDSKDVGETILVGPGKYFEDIDIDVENLEIVSRDGPEVTLIAGDGGLGPTVDIQVDNIRFGSQPGTSYSGFTVFGTNQSASVNAGAGAAGSSGRDTSALSFLCATQGTTPTPGTGTPFCTVPVSPQSIYIENNIFQGEDDVYGIYIPGVIIGGHLVVQNNQFEAGPAFSVFGFQYGIYFDDTLVPAPISESLSLQDADVELLSNTFSLFDTAAIWFDGSVYESRVTIDPTVITGRVQVAGTPPDYSDYGIYFDDYIEVFSVVNITDTTISNTDTPIYASSGAYTSSDLTIADNHADHYSDQAIYIGDQYADVDVVISDNTFTGDPSGSTYCMYFDYGPNYWGRGQVTGNTCTNFTSYGLYASSGTYYWGDWLIDANTFTGHSSGAQYGIYTYETYDNSTLMVSNNTVSQFYDTGIYHDYTYDRSTSTFDNNTVTGVVSGNVDGLYIYDTYYGSTTNITNNTTSRFKDAGIYNDDTYDGSTLNITDNTLTAHPSGAEYGIYVYDVYYGSTLNIDPNIVTGFGGGGFTGYGLYIDEIYDGAHGTVDNNTFTAHTSGADYGMYLSSGVQDGSDLAVTDNTFTGFDYAGYYGSSYTDYGSSLLMDGNTFQAHQDGATYGIYESDGLDDGSTGTYSNNDILGIGDGANNPCTCYEIYIYAAYYGSLLNVTGNTLTPHSNGTDYGIYISDGIQYGSIGNINNNTVPGIANDGYGLYVYEVYEGSQGTFCGNTITTHDLVPDPTDPFGPPLITPGSEGMYLEYLAVYGSLLNVCDNDVTGFTDSQVYSPSGGYTGSATTFDGNTLTGAKYDDPSYDSDYGLFIDDDLYDGYTLGVTNNDITTYHVAGIDFGGQLYGKHATISGNTLFGNGTEAAIDFEDVIGGSAVINVTQNCMGHSSFGVQVFELIDTAELNVNMNDFSGTPSSEPVDVGIRAVGVTNTVNGENNWWDSVDEPGTGNSVLVQGNVDYTPWSLSQNGKGCVGGAAPTPTNTPGTPSVPTPTATTPPTGKLCGDVNDNDVVNSIDASLLLQFTAGLVNTLPNLPSGDVNNDGSYTSVDAALILQREAGLITQEQLHCPVT